MAPGTGSRYRSRLARVLAPALLVMAPTVSAAAADNAKDTALLPLHQVYFEENRGAWPEDVRYASRGPGYHLLLAEKDIRLRIPEADGSTAEIRMEFVGGKKRKRLEPLDPLPGVVNYFLGSDPSKWMRGIRTWSRARYDDVRPGVDVLFYTDQGRLAFDVHLRAGTDPSLVRLRYYGVDRLSVDAQGHLHLHRGTWSILQAAPKVFQDGPDGRVLRPSRYRLVSRREVAFEVEEVDNRRALYIDPAFVTTSVLSGGGDDFTEDVAVDSAGNIYVAGQTQIPGFFPLGPIGSGFDESGLGQEGFVSKIDPTGTILLFTTFLGGGDNDWVYAIDLDETNGRVWATGATKSVNFPLLNAIDGTLTGLIDAFLLAFDVSGGPLIYATYLGGSDAENGTDVQVDGAGRPVVVGDTNSPDFPLVGPVDATCGTDGTCNHQGAYGLGDFFVSRFAADGQSMDFSTFLGGGDTEKGPSVAVVGSNAYVTGTSYSLDFPQVAPFPATYGGAGDAVFVDLDMDAPAVLFADYLGGAARDEGHGLAADGNEIVYIVGETLSDDFPVQNAAYPTRTFFDGFFARYNRTLFTLESSSYYPDAPIRDVAVDGLDNVYFTGVGYDMMPVVRALQPVGLGGSDAFVAMFSYYGSLEFASFFGGASPDFGRAVAIDAAGEHLYIAGYGHSRWDDLPNGVVVGTEYGASPPDYDVWVGHLDMTLRTVDLELRKVGVVEFNGKVKFTIEVENHGPDDAMNVVVTDTLPANATLDIYNTTIGSCTPAGSTLTCDITQIGADSIETITVWVVPDARATEVLNTATVTTTDVDADASNDTDSATVPIGLEADLQAALNSPPSTVLVGDTWNHFLFIDNYGPAGATGVEVTIATNANASLTSAVPSVGTCDLGVTPTVCDLGTVANGGQPYIELDFEALNLGTLQVDASVSSGQPDPNPWNNDAIALLTAVPRVDLQAGKSLQNGPGFVGQQMQYAVGAQNFGPDTATDVVLHDVFLSGALTIDSVTPSSGTCSIDGNEVTCAVGDLPDGNFAEMIILVTPNSGGEIVNDGFVTNSNGDRDRFNDRETLVEGVSAYIDLAVEISDAPDPSFADEPVTYDVTVSSLGPHIATQVRLINQLSGPVDQITSVVTSQGSCSYETYSSVVDCAIGALDMGQSADVSITVVPGFNGTLELTATASSDIPLLEQEQDSGNDQATEQTSVTLRADMALTALDLNGPVVVGNRLTTRVTLIDEGPDKATGVTLDVTLPAGVLFVSAASDQGSCNESGGVVTCDLGVMDTVTPVHVDLTSEPGNPGVIPIPMQVSAIQIDDDPFDNDLTHSPEILAEAPGDFVIEDLGTLGGVESFAYAINELGDVVGDSRDAADHTRAFLWEEGPGMQDLGVLPGWVESYARDINDAGRVVGVSGFEGFYRDPGGSPQSADTLPAVFPFSQLHGVNSAGIAAGLSRNAVALNEAVQWTEGVGMVGLGSPNDFSEAAAINTAGVVVGRYFGGAFVYVPGTGPLDLAGLAGTSSRAEDINEAGEVAGRGRPNGGTPYRAFRYLPPAGSYTDPAGVEYLGTLGGTTSWGLALNDSGQVAGKSDSIADVEERAFLWQYGTMWDLNSLLPPFSGWEVLQVATDLNDQAQIVGYGIIGGEVHAFLMTGTCRDDDGDGYGAFGLPVCPAGGQPDCDDTNPSIFPGAVEACDGVDSDCDGSIDPDQEQDNDFDGYTECEGDCDDANGAIHPGAEEINDGIDQNCGLVDELTSPISIWITGSSVFFTQQSGAWLHEIVQADDPEFTTGCISWTTEDPDMSVGSLPSFGQVQHLLVRPLAPNKGSWGAGSNDVERTPCAGACAHDKCSPGTSLFADCDPCVTEVCQNYPSCCSSEVSWSQFCANNVLNICNNLACDSQGSCNHSLCEQGIVLVPECDNPPLSPSCVTQICAVDSYCCNTSWDSLCVNEVSTVCGLVCE